MGLLVERSIGIAGEPARRRSASDDRHRCGSRRAVQRGCQDESRIACISARSSRASPSNGRSRPRPTNAVHIEDPWSWSDRGPAMYAAGFVRRSIGSVHEWPASRSGEVGVPSRAACPANASTSRSDRSLRPPCRREFEHARDEIVDRRPTRSRARRRLARGRRSHVWPKQWPSPPGVAHRIPSLPNNDPPVGASPPGP